MTAVNTQRAAAGRTSGGDLNILLTGKTDSIAVCLANTANGHKVALSARHFGGEISQKKVQTFDLSPDDPLFRRVFDVCSVEAAVFFLARGEHADRREGGINAFQNVLEHCSAAGVKLLILVSSGEVYSGLSGHAANNSHTQKILPYRETFSETTPPVPAGAQGCLLKAAEDLCLHYKSNTGADVVILRLPYIYARSQAGAAGDGVVGRLLADAAGGRGCVLPGGPDAPCDFLSEEDAARLIWQIIDEGFASESVFVNAGSEKPMAMGGVAELAIRRYPDVKITYSGNYSDMPPPMRVESAKAEYGWSPLYNLADDFAGVKPASTGGEPVKRGFRAFLSGWKGYVIIEFILVTALAYLLSVGLKGFSLTYWIDFRLLLVVIMSLLHGTVAGIAAAVAASALLFLTHDSYSPQLFIYNTENWIPFALYIIVGTVLGNSAEKQKDSHKAIGEKLALAERNAGHITDLCNTAVREKDEYRDQILSYKENYGRIYAVVQKLNSETPEFVLSSAVEALADVLANDSVAIYAVTNGEKCARQAVRAKGFSADFPRSILLDDYRRIAEKASRREIWFNQNLLPDYPAYCAPIYNGSRLIALILVSRADAGQMTLHYYNLIKIFGGLIQESLVNALKINALKYSEMYYPGTRMMRKEPFAEALKANIALAEQEKAEFGLIVMRRTDYDITNENNILKKCVREFDLFGMINRRLIGVILKQAFQEGAAEVLARLKKRGLSARPVTIRQMQDFIYKERGDLI